jgi:hypothetical protein
MAEADACPDLEQLRVLRGRKRFRFDAERLRRTPDDSSVTDRIGCRQQHQLLSRLGQLGKTSQVVLLETVRQAARVGKREATGELCSSQTSRQLQQRKRIATRFRDYTIANPLVESARDRRRQQRASILLVEAVEHQLGQTYQLGIAARLAKGEHERYRLREQASRDESKCLR